MSSSDIAIRVQGLSKAYTISHNRLAKPTFRDVIMDRLRHPLRRTPTETFWALKDVSFEVKKGEVVGIIGRNGAGKSTLLKILSRITEPTSGRIELFGRVGSLLEVGTGFHPELTGRENIYLNGAILGMTRAEIKKQFDAIVDFAEVEKFLDTPVKRYSSGMYVRLAFAVAAHLNPEILVVDEVLAVGDAEFQKKCLGKMGEVARGGRTVLFVSHNMTTIRILCKTALLMQRGRIFDTGHVGSVIDRYLDASSGDTGSSRLLSHAHLVKSDEFSIEHAMLSGVDGQPSTQLRINERTLLRLVFEVRKRVRQVRIGVGLNTREGVRISTLHHTDGGNQPSDLDPGLYEVTFEFTNPLLPGRYLVSAGAHSVLFGATLDYIPEALRFEVLELATDGKHFEPHNSGLVRMTADSSQPSLCIR